MNNDEYINESSTASQNNRILAHHKTMNENTEFEKALLTAFNCVAAKAVTTFGPATFQDDVDEWKQPLLDIARKELKGWRYLLRRYKDGYEQGKLDMKKQMMEEISDIIDIYHKRYENGMNCLENIITDEMIHDYANKQSHEWWQQAMQKWNSLSEDEKEKYNQFIGFNDFSDVLMNELIHALKQVTHTKKLKYEEGNLAVRQGKKITNEFIKETKQ